MGARTVRSGPDTVLDRLAEQEANTVPTAPAQPATVPTAPPQGAPAPVPTAPPAQ